MSLVNATNIQKNITGGFLCLHSLMQTVDWQFEKFVMFM